MVHLPHALAKVHAVKCTIAKAVQKGALSETDGIIHVKAVHRGTKKSREKEGKK